MLDKEHNSFFLSINLIPRVVLFYHASIYTCIINLNMKNVLAKKII